MTANTRTYIQSFSEVHPVFNRDDLWAYLRERTGISKSTLSWYLCKMVGANLLVRVGRGIYSRVCKQPFIPVVDEDTSRMYASLHERFPFARFCIYKGDVISPLLHHLAPNSVLYIETGRDEAETVFNFLKESGRESYLRPDKDMISRYIDMGSPVCFVKNLVSEAPLQEVSGVPVPTLEKLLVDILRDNDFFYLQGAESERIILNATELYEVNRNRLLRYAGRRKVKEQLLSLLENKNAL